MKNYIAQNDWVIEGDTSNLSPQMKHAVDSILTTVQSESYETAGSGRQIPAGLIAIVVVVIFGSFFGFMLYNRMYWNKGKYPPFTRFKRVNYYDAVVYIAVRFMLCERESYSTKLVSLAQYLKIKFRDIPGHPMDSVRVASETPVSVDSTSFWLNKHLSVSEKKELFRFFGQMAISDGGLGRREHEYLSIILKNWLLDEKLLREIEEEIMNRKRAEATRESAGTKYRSVSLKEKYCRILGVAADANQEEIKKAHRKLVMLHHPDKYHGKNDFEKETAKMKFIEIQEAYEFLTQS